MNSTIKIISIVISLLLLVILTMTGCGEDFKSPVTIYITEDESMRQTTDISCTIKQMFTTEREESKSGFAYGYTKDGYGYAVVPNAGTQVVKTCYIVLGDESGIALRFIVEEKDYNLLTEGETITLKYTKRFTADGTPYDTAHCWFYWGTSRFIFDADVTEQVNSQQAQ